MKRDSKPNVQRPTGLQKATVVCRAGLKERILSALDGREGKFTAVDIAEAIDYPVTDGVYGTCPNVRRILTKLCKEGLLYQWVTGTGKSPFSITNIHKYDVNYLRRDSNLAKTLLEARKQYLNGYRFR